MPGGNPLPPSGKGRMVEARATRAPLRRAWMLTMAAAVGLSSVGCTMCPDPFDYSGPVPNGSSPQNDFRARSNGILPLGAAPRPWPLLVKDGTARPQENESAAAATEASGADGDDAKALQQTVAVVGESDESTTEGVQPAPAGDAEGSAPPALDPVPAVTPPLEPRPAATDDQPQVSPRPAAIPSVPPVPSGETPGWRARRR